METDGDFGLKVEHHKNGNGEYEWRHNGRFNDGKVREHMDNETLREKDDPNQEANGRVTAKYQEKCGTYNLFTDNCQHASDSAYEAADEEDSSCSLM